MRSSDIWATSLIILILAACIPFELPKPSKAYYENIPYKECKPEPVSTPHTIVSPEYTKSALEYEIDDLRLDLDSCRSIIRNFKCYCED